MRVSSTDHDSVFMVDFNVRNKEDALKLTENVNENVYVYDKEIVYVEYAKHSLSASMNALVNLEITKTFGKMKV